MEIQSKNKYTRVGEAVQGVQTLLKIGFIGSVEFNGKGEQMGMQLLLEGDRETTGEFLFQDKLGLNQSGTSDTSMDMTIGMTGAQNMTISITQFIKMKITQSN